MGSKVMIEQKNNIHAGGNRMDTVCIYFACAIITRPRDNITYNFTAFQSSRIYNNYGQRDL